jgi:hypothetical protein
VSVWDVYLSGVREDVRFAGGCHPILENLMMYRGIENERPWYECGECDCGCAYGVAMAGFESLEDDVELVYRGQLANLDRVARKYGVWGRLD